MKIIIMEGKRFEPRKFIYRRYIYCDFKIRRWKGKYRLFCILFILTLWIVYLQIANAKITDLIKSKVSPTC